MPHSVCSNCPCFIYRAAGVMASYLQGEWRWDLLLASFPGACRGVRTQSHGHARTHTHQIPGRALAAWHRRHKCTGSAQPPAQSALQGRMLMRRFYSCFPGCVPGCVSGPPQMSPRTARRMPLQMLRRGGFPGHLPRTTPRMPPRTPPATLR